MKKPSVRQVRLAYEASLALLAFAALFLFYYDLHGRLPAVDGNIARAANGMIWLIFSVDYFVRLFVAKDKKAFFKANVFELIAILPLGVGFRAARIVAFLKFLRFTAFFARFLNRVEEMKSLRHFLYILTFAAALILTAALLVAPLEQLSFFDAVYWAIVTVATVGYGDIAPVTVAGRWIAIALILCGIGIISGTIGILTSRLLHKSRERLGAGGLHPLVSHYQRELDRFEELKEEDLEEMIRVLKLLKKKEE